MKTVTTKAMELVNKAVASMECPFMRRIPLLVFDREIELIALIALSKFALIATVIQRFKPAIIAAIIVTTISYITKCVATVQAILEAIDDYHEWRSKKEAYNAYATFMRNLMEKAQAEEAAASSEKNQE